MIEMSEEAPEGLALCYFAKEIPGFVSPGGAAGRDGRKKGTGNPVPLEK